MVKIRIHKWHIGLLLTILGIGLIVYDAHWHSTYGVGKPEFEIEIDSQTVENFPLLYPED